VHEKPTGPDAGKVLPPYLGAATTAPSPTERIRLPAALAGRESGRPRQKSSGVPTTTDQRGVPLLVVADERFHVETFPLLPTTTRSVTGSWLTASI
jgi:hypothetical protein